MKLIAVIGILLLLTWIFRPQPPQDEPEASDPATTPPNPEKSSRIDLSDINKELER